MEVTEALDSIQSEFLQQADSDNAEPSSPIIALREEGFKEAEAAAKAFDAHDLKHAYSISGLAVDDLLSLLAVLRRLRSEEIPDELAAHLSADGINDPGAQREAIQRARESVLFPPLNMALQIRYCCAVEREPDKLSEVTALAVPIARLILGRIPGDPGAALNLALALMACAAGYAQSGDGATLNQAADCLSEALQVIDKIQEARMNEPNRRPDEGWIRYERSQRESALQAIARALEAARKREVASLEADLRSLHSQFMNVSGRFQNR